MSISELFDQAQQRIAVPDEVLEEARERRDRIREIVAEEFAVLRTFPSGSLAHGTQNDPLLGASRSNQRVELARRG